ncbi:type II toxin-antitoxin system VapC family toxin [Streptomyces parvus]|uniref:Ribonuclease VapC n=1 Tax=Streptomyces parvus TaxID=66428 RepID=A0A7K3S4Y0_9ACTN|nr:type II toxin-antitoxin system VapC family toxin [Streptomyces parvus]NEC22565.1 type II toxin-antitoxin system VapC family toxin [Streptomyces parvus]
MIYLDSSALVKLIVREKETDALVAFLAGRPQQRHVTSELARTEVMRAVRRTRCGPQGQFLMDESTFNRLLAAAETRLNATDQMAVDADILDAAGEFEEFNIRSLDAIHLASALTLRPALTDFVAYDARLREHAENHGFQAVAPS